MSDMSPDLVATRVSAAERLLTALALPPEARVDQRIPKKLFQEHGAPTAADRRLVQEGIEEATWVAALKPATVGVAVYRDATREYLEVAVLAVILRPHARAARLTELIHRAVPYPVVLVTVQGEGAVFSLAHKRHSQAETAQWVTEALEQTAPLTGDGADPVQAAFFASLALAEQPSQDLLATYQGWTDRVAALASARVTGRYRVPGTPHESATGRAALAEYTRLTRERVTLRLQAAQERQLARRVELNLAIRRLDTRLAQLTSTL